ncbi:MAG TPA: Bug family tripartite tricarboxylate transporter substrate binding protein [Rubrivivax sp.]|nr:Bug family tripartite tricarboxylate transporter substrate binding protein [Rubrivivax sp.]
MSFASLTRRCLHALTLGAALCLTTLGASAQPGAPVRLLVGFPAGGSFDAIARLLADKLKDELKRPVIVDNKTGAGGRLAVDALKAAPHDGSTVMLGPDALTVLYPFTMSKLNYDPKKDLLPLGTVSDFPFALATAVEPPSRTLAEFVAWAKANPAKANFGIPARGAPHHFFGLVLGEAIGVPMQDVPFQGSAPMLVALIGGQISSSVDVLGSLIEQHRAGKLRMLAVSSPQRVPQAPEVPTFSELGYPAITGMGFNGLYAPAGTPPAVVAEWNAALNKVLALPEVRSRLEGWGFTPAPGTPQALADRGNTGAERWAPVIKASGFRAD